MRMLQGNTLTAQTPQLQTAPATLADGSLYTWAIFTPFVQFEGENLLLKAALGFYLYLYLYLYSYARW